MVLDIDQSVTTVMMSYDRESDRSGEEVLVCTKGLGVRLRGDLHTRVHCYLSGSVHTSSIWAKLMFLRSDRAHGNMQQNSLVCNSNILTRNLQRYSEGCRDLFEREIQTLTTLKRQ